MHCEIRNRFTGAEKMADPYYAAWLDAIKEIDTLERAMRAKGHIVRLPIEEERILEDKFLEARAIDNLPGALLAIGDWLCAWRHILEKDKV